MSTAKTTSAVEKAVAAAAKATTKKVAVASNRAETLMRSVKPVSERAEKYAERIATSIQTSYLNPLLERIEAIDDKIFDLENFSIATDLNKGLKSLTKEDIQGRFLQIMELRYAQDLLKAEYDSKLASFELYFG